MMSSDLTLSLILAGGLGAAIGSWLNVVILRTHQDRSWISGRSACPHCGSVLRWYELIPVASFVLLGGRCRHCRKSLSRQYIIVELLAMIGFMVIWAHWPWSWMALIAAAVFCSMIIIAVFDARWALIPDTFSLAFIVSSIFWLIFGSHLLFDALIGGVGGTLFFAGQHFLSSRRWVGSGDIFLGLGLGILLGWRMLALAFFLAYTVGAVVALAMMVSRRLSLKSTVAFGPYLMAAGFAAWLWGQQIVDWYFNHALFM